MVLYPVQCHAPRKCAIDQANKMEFEENTGFSSNNIGRLLFLRLILWLSSLFFCHLVTTSHWIGCSYIPTQTFSKCHPAANSILARTSKEVIPCFAWDIIKNISHPEVPFMFMIFLTTYIFGKTSKFIDVFPSKCEYSPTSI